MDKKAVISISSIQEGRKEDAIEVLTPGNFTKHQNGYSAEYDETKISGMEGTTTKIEISPEKLMLIREGTTTTKMEFEKNNKCTTMYTTQYGSLELVIETKNLDIDIDDNGGNIFINYNMLIGGVQTEKTELKINIKA
ncbi:DUF1934 domain-containing protein [Clostridium oryzae]|uniref:Putative beta-barrel protein YwiB n=1 Tax=Clostridium oryzae TaxID=1450648 RepID=A0A1V4ITZ4_9CLOT|nr:DUF1934 domain-containing protein [Clostridium oryzae]OPJ63406.1 putative beta-barrel protein YwiB [Clostridium oryzae]